MTTAEHFREEVYEDFTKGLYLTEDLFNVPRNGLLRCRNYMPRREGGLRAAGATKEVFSFPDILPTSAAISNLVPRIVYVGWKRDPSTNIWNPQMVFLELTSTGNYTFDQITGTMNTTFTKIRTTISWQRTAANKGLISPMQLRRNPGRDEYFSALNTFPSPDFKPTATRIVDVDIATDLTTVSDPIMGPFLGMGTGDALHILVTGVGSIRLQSGAITSGLNDTTQNINIIRSAGRIIDTAVDRVNDLFLIFRGGAAILQQPFSSPAVRMISWGDHFQQNEAADGVVSSEGYYGISSAMGPYLLARSGDVVQLGLPIEAWPWRWEYPFATPVGRMRLFRGWLTAAFEDGVFPYLGQVGFVSPRHIVFPGNTNNPAHGNDLHEVAVWDTEQRHWFTVTLPVTTESESWIVSSGWTPLTDYAGRPAGNVQDPKTMFLGSLVVGSFVILSRNPGTGSFFSRVQLWNASSTLASGNAAARQTSGEIILAPIILGGRRIALREVELHVTNHSGTQSVTFEISAGSAANVFDPPVSRTISFSQNRQPAVVRIPFASTKDVVLLKVKVSATAGLPDIARVILRWSDRYKVAST